MNKNGIAAQNLNTAWKSSSAYASDQLENRLDSLFKVHKPPEVQNDNQVFSQYIAQNIRNSTKAKYKMVDKKKNPIPLGVTRNPVVREPYKELPPVTLSPLPVNPPKLKDFAYTARLTPERIKKIISNIPNDFLTAEELDLLLHVVSRQEKGLAFDESERGIFKPEYFPDYVMETVPHIPWELPPIKPPKAIVATMIQMIKDQLKAGKYKMSWSSYRSQMFTVEKPKGGFRIVHDLQPLNAVSVKDSSLPPNINDFADSFVGHSVYIVADLFAGYDGRRLAEESQELTTTDSPLGPVKLTSLPQGYTNSMQEFMRTVTHVIKPMIPHEAEAFVDDVAGKGPKTRYNEETIPGNPNIRRFIWEFAHVVERLLATFITAGCTASGTKLVLATPLIHIVGNVCSMEGRRPHHGIVTKIQNWPRPTNIKEVRGFLGTMGVTRNWIWKYAEIAKPLTMLTRKTMREFEWTNDAENAMVTLKKLAADLPTRKALDISIANVKPIGERTSDYGLVTLAVDSSIIAVGWIEYQTLEDGRHPLMFGSITNNEAETKYSQPQIELKGLYKAIMAQRNDLWGIHFKAEVDAKFLKQTINTPGLPSQAMSRWISYIQLFDFELAHVPAMRHTGPDGLSRRPHDENDTENTEDELEIDEPGHFISGPRFLQEWETWQTSAKTSSVLAITQLKRETYEDLMEPRWNDQAYTIPPEHEQALNGGYIALICATTVSNNSESQESARTSHPHKIKDRDGLEYWKDIETYLETLEIPKHVKNRKGFIQTTRRYFLYNDALWRRNNRKLPQRVIKEENERLRLCAAAHDDSGHRGRDPTFKKLIDRFFWPNMWTQVAWYCRTCHECQQRSATRPKITLSPTYVHTIL